MSNEVLFRVQRRVTRRLVRRTFVGPGPGGPTRRSLLIYLDYEREFGNPRALASAEAGFRGVVSILERADVRATWCSVGLIADVYPQTLVELAARGHEIACHTYTHRPPTAMSRGELANEVVRFREKCAELCGASVLGFHSPLDRWTLSLPEILSRSGYTYDIARESDLRQLHAHFVASALRPFAPAILRIPSVADDWPYISENTEPRAMTDLWMDRIRAVPLGQTIAIGFHPWVLGMDPRRLDAFADFVGQLAADDTVALLTGSKIWNWYAGDDRH